MQAEVLKFVPRLSVTRDNENILRRATFTELKFIATTVKIMGSFIYIHIYIYIYIYIYTHIYIYIYIYIYSVFVLQDAFHVNFYIT